MNKIQQLRGSYTERIQAYYAQAKLENATHFLVVTDTLSNTEYPVFVKQGHDLDESEKFYSRNFQKVQEIYNMSMDVLPQIQEARAYNK